MKMTRTDIGGIRRDSGYSPAKDDSLRIFSPSLKDDTPDSGDSGVGSPSPHSTSREWGRRFFRRNELHRIREIQRNLEDLAAVHGGEVFFQYTPRIHPNLPQLKDMNKTRLHIPMKEVDAPICRVPTEPGQFLQRTGLTPQDIFSARLPEMPSGGLAVLSNGLAFDLHRLCKTNPKQGSAVVKFIFHFLELNIPPGLYNLAVEETLKSIAENLEYIASCQDEKEKETFLFAPFLVPKEVSEIGSIEEELEQEEDLYLSISPEPSLTNYNHSVSSSGDEPLVVPNQYVGIKIENDGNVETFEISALEDVFSANVELAHLEDPKNIKSEDQNELSSFLKDGYGLIHSEDGDFSVTATLLSLPEGIVDTDSTEIEPEPPKPVRVSESEPMKSPCSEAKKRYRTREVQIPSRFRDFTAGTPSKRKKQ